MNIAQNHITPDNVPLFAAHLFPLDLGRRSAKVERLARRLATTAVERDRAGGSAVAERELLRKAAC